MRCPTPGRSSFLGQGWAPASGGSLKKAYDNAQYIDDIESTKDNYSLWRNHNRVLIPGQDH